MGYRKTAVHIVVALSGFGLLIFASVFGTPTQWWWMFLLWGTMLSGAVFQPLIKEMFPGPGSESVVTDRRRLLRDHETLTGYYPVVTIVLVSTSFLLAPILFQTSGTASLLHVVNPLVFLSASIVSGLLNVGIFYFYTKALRYGDISLVSGFQALIPVLALPVSLVAFSILGPRIISDPSVTWIGFFGIMIVVVALLVNSLTQKKTGGGDAPTNDWFAQHPQTSALLSVAISALAVNFDKIAIDSGNPFLAGIVTMLTVSLCTAAWTVRADGIARLVYIFKTYARSFLIVGCVYGLVIVVMNTTLYGHNVNYYGAVKRSSVVFATLYGMYVLGEGALFKDKIVRLSVGFSILAASFLIIFKG